jgi:hypothetical protein
VCEGDRTRDVSLPQTWSQALPFIAQGRGSGLHGGKRRKRRKRIAEQYEGESLHGDTVLLLGVGPASPVIEDGGDPLQRRATATVATVVCHPSWWQQGRTGHMVTASRRAVWLATSPMAPLLGATRG